MNSASGYEIRPESAADASAIADLIEQSFGPERTGRTVYRFRKTCAPIHDLGFAVEHGAELVASIRFWPVRLPGEGGLTVPLLGPLAVKPHLRGYGLGRALVRHGLDAAREAGYPAVLIVGDAGYYAPFEFSVEPVSALDLGGPVAPLTFMGLEYRPSTLAERSGTVAPADR